MPVAAPCSHFPRGVCSWAWCRGGYPRLCSTTRHVCRVCVKEGSEEKQSTPAAPHSEAYGSHNSEETSQCLFFFFFNLISPHICPSAGSGSRAADRSLGVARNAWLVVAPQCKKALSVPARWQHSLSECQPAAATAPSRGRLLLAVPGEVPSTVCPLRIWSGPE